MLVANTLIKRRQEKQNLKPRLLAMRKKVFLFRVTYLES